MVENGKDPTAKRLYFAITPWIVNTKYGWSAPEVEFADLSTTADKDRVENMSARVDLFVVAHGFIN